MWAATWLGRLLLLALGLVPAMALAQPAAEPAWSATTLGLTGAGAAANAADPLALADNPAALAQFDRPAVALSGGAAGAAHAAGVTGAAVLPVATRLRLGLAAAWAEHDGGGNVLRSPVRPALGIALAPSLAVGLGAIVDNDVAGASLGVQWQPTSTARGGLAWHQATGRAAQVIALGGAVEMRPDLALHAGLSWRQAGGGDALDAAAGLEWRRGLSWALRAGMRLDTLDPTAAGIAAGLSWRPVQQLDLGLAWQVGLGARQDGDRALLQLTLRF
ncbi:hypothetical protein [Zavarzinia sp. CC-PAN008]|uniref:hypothetical protein n=1 Tax=Zavarzinia sp. CC-PAN008 TaxID=3243332 RepID=UPI003F74505A